LLVSGCATVTDSDIWPEDVRYFDFEMSLLFPDAKKHTAMLGLDFVIYTTDG